MRPVPCPAIALLAMLPLGACAVTPPAGPTILAAPGVGRSFEQFRYDDFRCRRYASLAGGGVSPQQAASASGLGSVAVGTALGAAIGALLGAASGSAGLGAAFGAGTGLLLGSAVGSGNAEQSARSVQADYDRSYAGCMLASGEDVGFP